jgi:hypothetical protein
MRFLPIALMLLCGAALAADVSFEGTLDADYGNYLEKDLKINNAANQDLRLKMNVDMDENVRVVVGAASKSSYTAKSGDSNEFSRIRHREEATPISSDRWNPFVFDGISLEWTVRRDLTFIFGDLFYSFGSFNYYFWRNPDNYAAILTTQGMRGLGARFGNEGYVYIGASNANDKSGRIAASYAIAIPGLDQVNNKLTLAPMLDLIKAGGRSHRYTFGVDANYSRSYTDFNYAIRGIYGIHPSHGNLVNTFTVEPSLNYKDFSLASTCYWALLADSTESSVPITIDHTYASDERLIYIEPSYSFHKKFSTGLGFEWHKPGEDSDDWFLIAPTGYLYPTAGIDLAFWISYAITEGHNNPGFGISSSVKF